jgi:hypothetical protein
MGGLVLDILVVFLWKGALRIIGFIKSMRWVRTTVSVFRGDPLDPYWGCPSVRVHYRIGTNQDSLEGCDEVPFLLRQRAKRYAAKLSLTPTIIVRVNPANSAETQFFASDQG